MDILNFKSIKGACKLWRTNTGECGLKPILQFKDPLTRCYQRAYRTNLYLSLPHLNLIFLCLFFSSLLFSFNSVVSWIKSAFRVFIPSDWIRSWFFSFSSLWVSVSKNLSVFLFLHSWKVLSFGALWLLKSMIICIPWIHIQFKPLPQLKKMSGVIILSLYCWSH